MKVLVLGAGGAASNGFARALKLAADHELVGTNCSENDLLLSECGTNHLIRPASDFDGWRRDLYNVIAKTRPDFVHAQNDGEVKALARYRTTVHMLGAKTFLPDTETNAICQDKYESYLWWRDYGLTVPKTVLLDGYETLTLFFDTAPRWIRPRTGAGGRGSLKTGDRRVAQAWMWHHNGYGEFTAAECLTPQTVTVQALYWKGSLVCSQQRARQSWANAGATTAGVSGSTGVGMTTSDPRVDEIADRAVRVINAQPHGLFGIDLALNDSGVPCPTEINAGRFFTTAPEFFARAGFNMAAIYVRYGERGPVLTNYKQINPLRAGKRWIRGMDREPVLV